MTKSEAKELVQHVTKHMERESALLYPFPQTIMNDPYRLLDLIKKLGQIPAQVMDEWMVEAQKEKKP